MKMNLLFSILFLSVILICDVTGQNEFNLRPLAKFEPSDQVLLFVGQELEAIGGLDKPYDDGYLDHFETPAGFTMYTNLSPGDESFGLIQKGLDGVWTTDDWGDSPSNMTMQLSDRDFNNLALAIGLSMVNHEEAVAKGQRDDLIKKMGEWFKRLAPRPVFLRIGYEFDGHSWNHYDRENYIKAFQRIKDILDEMGVTNVAYVWQSTGWVSDPYQLEEWYPGDAYVDWCALSFFSRWREIEMFDFARKKGKPVFIAEATPTISDHTVKFDGKTVALDLSKKDEAALAWERWFVPFFDSIEENKDVVKAISYINCNWKSHRMWYNNPTFQKVDARLQLSKDISEKWNNEINNGNYLLAKDDFFELGR